MYLGESISDSCSNEKVPESTKPGSSNSEYCIPTNPVECQRSNSKRKSQETIDELSSKVRCRDMEPTNIIEIQLEEPEFITNHSDWLESHEENGDIDSNVATIKVEDYSDWPTYPSYLPPLEPRNRSETGQRHIETYKKSKSGIWSIMNSESQNVINELDLGVSTDPNDYVIDLGYQKMNLLKNLLGYYECPSDGCNFKKIDSSQVEKHFTRKHSKEKPFQCKFCGKQFTYKYLCIEHIRTHDESLKIRCELCDVKVASQNALKYHHKMAHNNYKSLIPLSTRFQ